MIFLIVLFIIVFVIYFILREKKVLIIIKRIKITNHKAEQKRTMINSFYHIKVAHSPCSTFHFTPAHSLSADRFPAVTAISDYCLSDSLCGCCHYCSC